MNTDLTTIINLIGNGGGMVFLIAYMIYQEKLRREDKIVEEQKRCEREEMEQKRLEEERKRNNATLERLAQANENLAGSTENVANTLQLLKKQMETNDNLLRGHDERAIKIKEEMTEIKTIVGSCRK